MQNSIKNFEQNWRHTAEVNCGFFRFLILMIMFTKFYQLFTFTPPPLSALHKPSITPESSFHQIFVWTPYNVLYSYDNTKASTKSLKGAYYFVYSPILPNPTFPFSLPPTTRKSIQPNIFYDSLDSSMS